MLLVLLYVQSNTSSIELFVSTSNITESHVKSEIQDIQAFTRMYGYPLICKPGVKYGSDARVDQRCEKVDQNTDWTGVKESITECFSKFVPVLEDMRCNHKNATS